MDPAILTSTTDSVGLNRASHAIKVALSATLTHLFLKRFPLTSSVVKSSLSVGAVAFPVPVLAFHLISRCKRSHSPDPYNKGLNCVWGAPRTARARVQVPLATGIELTLLALYLRSQPAHWSTLVKGAGAILFIGPQVNALWDVLSRAPKSWKAENWVTSSHGYEILNL